MRHEELHWHGTEGECGDGDGEGAGSGGGVSGVDGVAFYQVWSVALVLVWRECRVL